MVKPALKAPALPPPTVARCWLTFWAWVLGVPLLVAGALGVIWVALWALGSMPMEARAAAIAEAAALAARPKRRARKKD